MAHSLAANDSGKASDLESESKLSATEELIRELLNSESRHDNNKKENDP